MSTTVESSVELQSHERPSDASLPLPNVFVTPPEDEYDTPPWCCFDADKDAQPGAFVYEDLVNAELDYSAHADDDAFGGDSAIADVVDREERGDVFVMHSLVAEAESLREKLRSLELSNRAIPALSTVEEGSGEPEVASTVQSEPELPKSRKDIVLSSSVESGSDHFAEITRMSTERDQAFEIVQRPESPNAELELQALQSMSRKQSFFSRRFKLSPKKAPGSAIGLGLRAKPSMEVHHSCETLDTPRLSQDQDQTMKRRFSFFDLPRSRFSTSSQSTTPTASSIAPSTNFSSSSLATSSVPPTPECTSSMFISPPDTPIEGFSEELPMEDPPSSLMATMDVSVVNLAASLSLPTSYHGELDAPFSLDLLHFESLQFDSDDFP
ncbi:hypothetical protein EW145_g2642 [Phellinidium pouzarii]|uniref:Uncharacterized protein n=1 Tax=Phellinidium pouzarii TaxID=167371 RepID=A0A4S4LAJ0_9AGAM|nr:hypothetical protein EW145_g2642 [Phellinidium pouzarii]